jgi:hypothetical protein
MNIRELKEYINDLPDDMEVKLSVDYVEYIADFKVNDNKLIIN